MRKDEEITGGMSQNHKWPAQEIMLNGAYMTKQTFNCPQTHLSQGKESDEFQIHNLLENLFQRKIK